MDEISGILAEIAEIAEIVGEKDNMENGKKWTETQSETIGFPGRGLLLSAGAGSGKTATLTERVGRLVCDESAPAPISRMLIVTFTVAAAKELKDRIGKRIEAALEKNPGSAYLIKQAMELESAEISTISSFFYRAVRPYAAKLSLPPDFRVAESAVTDVMKKRIMNEVTDDFFDSGDENFIILADSLSGSKDENSLSDVLLSAAERMAAKGIDAEDVGICAECLEETGSGDFFKTPHGGVIKENTLKMLSHYHGVFSSIRGRLAEDKDVEKAYGSRCDALISDTEYLKITVEKGSFSEAAQALCSYTAPALGRLKEENKTSLSAYFASVKSRFSSNIKDLCKNVFSCGEELIKDSCRRTALICRTLAAVLGEFYTRFENEKKEKGLVDFGDLETYAKRIFCNPDGTPSEAALEFSKQYDYIFIDEYQDTNKTQDAVFSAVSSGMKRFMVGDVKQSIYAFRGADPSVFNAYREKWKPYGEIKKSGKKPCEFETTVFMNENFRSDKNVIDFANLVSEYMFPGSDTPFEAEDRLIFSKIRPEGFKYAESEICLISGEILPDENPGAEYGTEPDGNGGKTASSEYGYVAERIASMIKNERRPDGSPFEPKDFAILLRSASKAGEFAKALNKRGVPVRDRASEQFFEQPEILLVMCILNAIDNPLRDIYLAGAMKSPVFGFTVDDMLKIRFGKTDRPLWYCVEEYISNGEDVSLIQKCAAFADFEAEFRSKARRLDAAALLSALYEKLSLMSLSESEDDSPAIRERIRRNLTALYEHARQYEKNSFSGLYGFISYLGELMESKLETEKISSEENAVTVTTIHKSKGLEFPVCFLCESIKKFSDKDTRENLLFAPGVGIAMKLRDSSGLVECSTPLRFAVAERIRQNAVFEEMRILYVAMTRAAERLIICAEETASGEGKDFRSFFERAKLEAFFSSPYSKMNCTNYLSWILPAAALALRDGKAGCFELKFIRPSGYGFTEIMKPDEKKGETPEKELSELFRRRFEYEYPYRYLQNIPAKLTVSKLKPDILDGDGELCSIESYADAVKKDVPFSGERHFSSEYRESDFEGETREAPVPVFMSGDEGDEKEDFAFVGTASHVFLQFCDFRALSLGKFDSELERLLKCGFISEKMAHNVDRGQIEAFAKSALMKEILSSPVVKREFRFNVSLPADGFTSDENLAKELRDNGCDIIVQGVCDLVFEDRSGGLVLIDYKTDRLTDFEMKHRHAAEEKLRSRHSGQLYYYKLAVEKIFAKKVLRAAVYSLPLGDTVDILI